MHQLTVFLERPLTRNIIMGIIIFNAILLGMETSNGLMQNYGTLITTLDSACLAVFVIELLAKLVAYRGRFFRSG